MAAVTWRVQKQPGAYLMRVVLAHAAAVVLVCMHVCHGVHTARLCVLRASDVDVVLGVDDRNAHAALMRGHAHCQYIVETWW